MFFPLPKWVEEMPEGRDKIRAENLFFFRLWRVYAGPRNSYPELAALLGINCSTLRSQATNPMVCGATDSTVKLIRELFGPGFLPSRRVPYSRES
jgi:hypothetical protein